MQIIVETILSLGPTKKVSGEVTLDKDAGLFGERLKLRTSNGREFMIEENDHGNLELLEVGAAALFTHNPTGNVVEIMPVPLFAKHVITEGEKA